MRPAGQCQQPARPGNRARLPEGLQGIHKIQHIIIIMQENRSFDSCFGVYPGADGIPMKGGKPTVCVPDPLTSKCVNPAMHLPGDPGGRLLTRPPGRVAQERSAPGARLYRPPDSVATNKVPCANTGWAKTLLAPTGSVLRMAPVPALIRYAPGVAGLTHR